MQEQNVKEESHVEYEYLTSLVRESIERVVPPKTWTEKNDRIVSVRRDKNTMRNIKQTRQSKKHTKYGTGKYDRHVKKTTGHG